MFDIPTVYYTRRVVFTSMLTLFRNAEPVDSMELNQIITIMRGSEHVSYSCQGIQITSGRCRMVFVSSLADEKNREIELQPHAWAGYEVTPQE